MENKSLTIEIFNLSIKKITLKIDFESEKVDILERNKDGLLDVMLKNPTYSRIIEFLRSRVSNESKDSIASIIDEIEETKGKKIYEDKIEINIK